MAKNLNQKIEKHAEDLKRQISELNAKIAFDHISSLILFHLQDLPLATGLHSPQKQLYFFAGLLTSTEPDGTKELTKPLLNKLVRIINRLSNEYGLFFSPADGDNMGPSRDWLKKREVTGPVFMDYFLTGELASEEQVISRITRWFTPFNMDIKDHFGMTVEEVLQICDFLKNYQKNLIHNQADLMAQLRVEHQRYVEALEKGIVTNIEEYKKKIAGAGTQQLAVDIFEKMNSLFEIEISELKQNFDPDIVDSFVQHYSVEKISRDYKFFTERNHFELSPLWRNNIQLNLGFVVLLHVAVYKKLYDFLATSPEADRFYNHRDKQTENKVENIFTEFLSGTNYSNYKNVFEDEHNQNEHDLIIIVDGYLFIIETKASKRKEPFRDPDKAFQRIQRDFNSDRGIQKAYEQGLRLKQKIDNNEETTLYDSSGSAILTINRSNIKKTYVIAVTAERFGIISTNLSLLLRKPENEPFPWACYIYDLETLLHSLKYKQFDFNKFIEYLDFREKYHEKFFATDELEIAGLFLTDKDFEIDISDPKYIFLNPELSRMFDKIYFDGKGMPYDNEVPTELEAVPQEKYLKDMTGFYANRKNKPGKVSNKEKGKSKKKQAKKSRRINKKKRK